MRGCEARWTLLLHQVVGGIDELHRFITYLGTVQDDNAMETFGAALKRHGLDPGGEIMTYAEKLLAEGEARGRMQAQVETAEGLLWVGVTWEVFEAATGLTEPAFETFKTQLSGSDPD